LGKLENRGKLCALYRKYSPAAVKIVPSTRAGPRARLIPFSIRVVVGPAARSSARYAARDALGFAVAMS
jgi:hypothetical protein